MLEKKASVLLVEDDRLAQKMAVILLTQLNCEVKAVSTAESAIESLQTQSFDLVLADIGLPDADGFSLIKTIRSMPLPQQELPIVMLTAHSDLETKTQSLQAGANDFYVKPLNKEIGQNILEKFLNL